MPIDIKRTEAARTGSAATPDAARLFALQAHGARTYGTWPHARHLDDVAKTMRELGFTGPEHQIVAYLHDVLDERTCGRNDVEQRFGTAIATAVDELARYRSGTGDVDGLGQLAFAVKVAERISNVRALGASGVDDPQRLLRKYEREISGFMRRSVSLTATHKRSVELLGRELIASPRRLSSASGAASLAGFFLVGDRPVQAVVTADGGLDVLAYDAKTASFVRDMSYLARITAPRDGTREVSREAFEEALQALRKR
ncbi:MAG: HD domain-containing protein [Myxococcota bacterium]|nr:HD domain-containing protein [Myxococcota bacterium]